MSHGNGVADPNSESMRPCHLEREREREARLGMHQEFSLRLRVTVNLGFLCVYVMSYMIHTQGVVFVFVCIFIFGGILHND